VEKFFALLDEASKKESENMRRDRLESADQDPSAEPRTMPLTAASIPALVSWTGSR
jgi:hypothetical protein